jgi:hypothetical protein
MLCLQTAPPLSRKRISQQALGYEISVKLARLNTVFVVLFLIVRSFFHFLAPCLALQFYLTPNIVNLLAFGSHGQRFSLASILFLTFVGPCIVNVFF